MNNIEQAISFARQEYTRQGLGALYQKDFEEALLPALSQAAEIYRADTLRWSGDPKTDLLAALLWSQKLLNDYTIKDADAGFDDPSVLEDDNSGSAAPASDEVDF